MASCGSSDDADKGGISSTKIDIPDAKKAGFYYILPDEIQYADYVSKIVGSNLKQDLSNLLESTEAAFESLRVNQSAGAFRCREVGATIECKNYCKDKCEESKGITVKITKNKDGKPLTLKAQVVSGDANTSSFTEFNGNKYKTGYAITSSSDETRGVFDGEITFGDTSSGGASMNKTELKTMKGYYTLEGDLLVFSGAKKENGSGGGSGGYGVQDYTYTTTVTYQPNKTKDIQLKNIAKRM